MKKFTKLQLAHFIYLMLMISFILVYFTNIRPEKIKAVCAEKVANVVVKLNPSDAYGRYQVLFSQCLSEVKIDIAGL